MSTAYFLICEGHREIVKTSNHRAQPPLHDDQHGMRLTQFCYRHTGCSLKVVNEHSRPYSEEYTEFEVVELPQDGHIGVAPSLAKAEPPVTVSPRVSTEHPPKALDLLNGGAPSSILELLTRPRSPKSLATARALISFCRAADIETSLGPENRATQERWAEADEALRVLTEACDG